jgi:hypothetical protein
VSSGWARRYSSTKARATLMDEERSFLGDASMYRSFAIAYLLL